MTAGSSEVELWGGKDGLPTIEKDDAKFHFLKAATDPTKDVDPRELDTKQGMITELLYVADDSPPKTQETTRRRREQPTEETSDEEEESEEETAPAAPSYVRKRPTVIIESQPEPLTFGRRRRNPEETSVYRTWQPPSSSPTTETPVRRRFARDTTPEVTETAKSYDTSSTPCYLRKRTSPTRTLAEKPSWLKPRTPTTTASSDSPFGERLSRPSTRSTDVPSWKRSTPTNDTSYSTTSTSRFGSSSSTPSYLSRYSRESSVSKDTSNASARPYTSRYSRDSSVSKDTPSSSTKPSYLSKYSRDSSVSKDTPSKTSDSTTSSSLSRRDSTTGSSVPSYRRDSSITRRGVGGSSTYTPTSSLYRTDTSASYNRLGRDTAVAKLGSRFEPQSSSVTRYGSSLGSTSSYGSRFLGSSYSRFR